VVITKQKIREQIWDLLEAEGVARFPGTHGRIPNFKGAEKCVEQIAKLAAWQNARAIKVNPDAPQRAIRHLALKQGKVVYMAVPRLRDEKCFIELDPHRLREKLYAASSIKGAFALGRPLGVDDVKPIDLIVCGSVAVSRTGVRVGKGGGYSDLEYAIGLEMGLLTHQTPIVTTVHPLQIAAFRITQQPHDIPLDFIVTPTEIIECHSVNPRPKGLYWKYLDQEKINAIPLLRKLV
jgi:5-formyltetrahydrofolate cyclo-ligase